MGVRRPAAAKTLQSPLANRHAINTAEDRQQELFEATIDTCRAISVRGERFAPEIL